MEISLCIIVVIIVSTAFLKELSNLLNNLTNFVRQLHSKKPKALLGDGKTISLSLTVGSRHKKRNLRGKHKSHKKRLD